MYISQPSKITGIMANRATAGPWIFQSSRNSGYLHPRRQDHAEDPGVVDAGANRIEPS